MSVGIGASGFVGIAVEATPGTYLAPTYFFPIKSESLQFNNNTQWRNVIRGTADKIGAVRGDGGVEGDIEAELIGAQLVNLLIAARGTWTKSVAPAPFTYDWAPEHGATPNSTLSITVVRNGVAFGYTGCVVGGMSFSVDNGQPMVSYSILGRTEEDVSVPTPTYAEDDPFGAGEWTIEVPTAAQIFDADNFSLEISDSGNLENRLKNTVGAQFVSFGERDVDLSLDRDFDDKTEYTSFRNLTETGITVKLEKVGLDNSIEFVIPATVKDSYEVSLGGVGDLIRASIAYKGTHDPATGAAYSISVLSTVDVTLPV